jgi:hypothetical protein
MAAYTTAEQTPADRARALSFKFGVGAALDYFFDW